MCVCYFSPRNFSETLLIRRRTQRDIITMYTGVHVNWPLFLVDFNQTWILLTDFRKLHNYQIS